MLYLNEQTPFKAHIPPNEHMYPAVWEGEWQTNNVIWFTVLSIEL